MTPAPTAILFVYRKYQHRRSLMSWYGIVTIPTSLSPEKYKLSQPANQPTQPLFL